MDSTRWIELLIKYPKACTLLYFWIIDKQRVIEYEVDQETFIKALTNNHILENEEKSFRFFDDLFIRCGVFPLGHKQFRCFATSEYRTFVCHDEPDRYSAIELAVCNALDLLEERILKTDSN